MNTGSVERHRLHGPVPGFHIRQCYLPPATCPSTRPARPQAEVHDDPGPWNIRQIRQ